MPYCSSCGYGLQSVVAFCSSCGSKVSLDTSGLADPFFDKRAGAAGFTRTVFKELKLLGINTLVPYEEWLSDKTWNLLWVRWFLGLALFPLILFHWAAGAHPAFSSIAFLFGIYFALMWAVVLYFMLRPRLAFKRIAQVTSFTTTFGIVLVLLLQRLPFFSSLYAETESASIVGRTLGFVFGVGIVEELVKVLPIWWLYVHIRNEDSLSTKVFLGCISGFAFGVSEAVGYSLAYAWAAAAGNLSFGSYLIIQLTRLITLPLLHAIWAGVFAYFVALASVNREVQRGLLLAGLLIAATLHGLYDASDGLLGVVFATLSILLFLAYYRAAQTLQGKISSLFTPPPIGSKAPSPDPC